MTELEQLQALRERLRNRGVLLPPEVVTNIPALAEAQARRYSIANEAQPQDAEALDGVQGWQRYMGGFGLGINDTLVGGALTVPAEYILAPLGKLSEAIFGGESSFTRGAQQLFDWDAAYKKASSERNDHTSSRRFLLPDHRRNAW